MWKSLQSLGRIALRSTPLYRHAGGESQAIREVRARALPSIQQMGGSVVVNESNNDGKSNKGRTFRFCCIDAIR